MSTTGLLRYFRDRDTTLEVCFIIKVTRENQVFLPPFTKKGSGGIFIRA